MEYEKFGGLITYLRAENVPVGFSPNLQNVRYKPGSVETRPGLTSRLTKAGRTLTGAAQFLDNLGNKTLITLDDLGDLDRESGGAPVSIKTRVAVAGAMLRTQLAFNRIFLAFYGGTLAQPRGPLRHWDGTNLDQVSPDGPGAAASPADSVNAGSITAGVHKVYVSFELRSGYVTEPSLAGSWTAAGAKKTVISSIPTGPAFVVARRLLFTAAAGEDLFFLTTFRLGDNTSTSVEIDFTDLQLQQGENVNKLQRNFRLPEQSGVGFYNLRIVTWGGLNTVKMRNLGFDGGFASGGEPLGWTQSGSFAGGAKEAADVFSGEAWKITGDGATASRGEIRKAPKNDAGDLILSPNIEYEVSARVKKFGAPTQGTLNIDLFGTAVDTTGLTLSQAAVTTEFVEYTASLTGVGGLATIPSDLVLRVFVDGTPTNLAGFIVDHIAIWPKNQKFDASTLRVSDPENPERFDGINGFVVVSKDDGQRVVACAQLRSFYYIAKERSLHVAEDDGVNPASLWPTRLVDDSVGVASPNAMDGTESFLAIAARPGAYLFFGGKPMKVSQEIEPTWRRINWQAAETIHTLVDPEQKVIYFYVPLDANTTPSHALTLDYVEGFGSEDDPGGRKWNLDLLPSAIRASLRFETAANKQAIYLAGAKVFEHTGTDDDGAAIDNFFETAFQKAGESGQDLFGGVSMTVSGSGTLISSIRGLDDIPTENLANLTLAAGPGKDFEVYANTEAERARVRVGTNAVGARFILKRLVLYAQPWAEVRAL